MNTLAIPRAPDVDGLLERCYPLAPDGGRHRDGTRPFYDWLLESIDRPSANVLNIGAGPTPLDERRRLRGRVARLVGVDVDPVVLANADLDEARVTDGIALPYAEATFDAAYSDWTMEHVEHPLALLREVHRVLKPGASYWLRTTNLHHYVTAISATTPYRFHAWLLHRCRPEASIGTPWPTHYHCNTRSAVRGLADQAGFSGCEVRMVESYPSYLMFSRLAFLLGVAYERVVNCSDSLAGFRLILLARARKAPDRALFAVSPVADCRHGRQA